MFVKTGQKRMNERMQHERTVTLRIKREFLELIAAGKKTKEYRELNPFYQNLFLTPFNKLKLHFQTSRQITVEVKNLSIVSKNDDDFFCLHLGEVLEQAQ